MIKKLCSLYREWSAALREKLHIRVETSITDTGSEILLIGPSPSPHEHVRAVPAIPLGLLPLLDLLNDAVYLRIFIYKGTKTKLGV